MLCMQFSLSSTSQFFNEEAKSLMAQLGSEIAKYKFVQFLTQKFV